MATPIARLGVKFAFAALAVMVALEALLRLVPLPDPFPLLRTREASRFHVYLPSWNAYGDWFGKSPPFAVNFHTGKLIGVTTEEVEFSVNSLGFPYGDAEAVRRSPEEIRIGVIGGSTVECAALRAGRRWPDMLESELKAELADRPITVLNMGVSGQDTRTYLATMAQHAVKLDLDYVVFMLGANDLFRTDPAEPLKREDAFLSRECRCFRAFVTNFQLVRYLRVIYLRFFGEETSMSANDANRPYFYARAQRLLKLPVLTNGKMTVSAGALDDYEKNVVSLAALATAHQITPIFTTQPMLWKPTMTPDEIEIDWLRGTVVEEGQSYRVPSSEQARSLELLNARLLDICAKTQLKCVDLEKRVPRSLQFFYDSVHLNEAGAAAVGKHASVAILQDLESQTRLPAATAP